MARIPFKALVLGAAAVAAGIAALLKRDKLKALLPGGDSAPAPPEPHVPGPSNYDAPGPVANTATPVPAPDPREPQAIDEQAEEAAAAAEAANIGGSVADYVGPTGERATEAERPLAEAGEGEAEGEEQAEFQLEQAAEPTAPGISDAERQIEDAIEAADNPAVGERVEGETAPAGEADSAQSQDDEDDGGQDWRTWSGRSVDR